MGKRKRSEDVQLLPPIVLVERMANEDGAGVGPFSVYFPSGFRPDVDAPCTWHVSTLKDKRNVHVITAKSVRTHVACLAINKLCKWCPQTVVYMLYDFLACAFNCWFQRLI